MARSKNKDEKRPKISKKGWQRAKQMLQYLRPYRWSFFGGFLFLILGSAIFMVFPVAAGELINIAEGRPQYAFLQTLDDVALLLGAVLVIQSIASYLRVLLFTEVSERGMAGIRKALYAKMITLPITFFEENRVGELASRSTADVQQIQDAISITLAEFIRQIIILLVGITLLVWKTWELALLMLAVFPAVILVAIIFGRYIRKLSKRRQQELADTNTVLEETLQSISVVKSFVNEWFEQLRYGKSVEQVVSTSIRFARIRGLFIVFVILILFGSMFFVLWQGAIMVQEGMPSGNLVTFITITAVIGGALASIGDFYTQLLKAVGASERVMDILDEEAELDANPPKERLILKGDVRYTNVAFTYPTRPDQPVLRSINMSIRAGQKVALVGASGAGKSTLVQLLQRFYEIDGGSIEVDGQPIDSYAIGDYRRNLGIVPQEVILFGGSIRENIAYGKTHASEEEIIEAAKKANAWEFIDSFSEGLDTVVGERGVKLSGGQRQRVAIARAILKNPSILILDEATSALDAESEKAVQEALHTLMEGRTSIIIAHRLATIKDVDCIYVLDNGRVIEEGTHQELSAQNGVYSKLAKLQFESAEYDA